MSRLTISRRRFLRTGTLAAAGAVCGCSSTDPSEGAPSSAPERPSAVESTVPETSTAPDTTTERADPVPAPPGATRYRPIRPTRIADTSRTSGWVQLADDRIRVPVAGREEIPLDAVAVALRVTGVDGAPVRIVTSSDDEPVVDVPGPSSTVSAFVLLGRGAVDVLHGTGSPRITVDVEGWFETATESTASGRFVATTPTTVLDTQAAARPFERSETRPVTADGETPPGAHAVVVRITTTSAGEWSVHPAGRSDIPSTLTSPSDSPSTATTIVALGNGGVEVTSSAGGHAVVDVVGHVTGDDVAVSLGGLFVPTAPSRLLDTRLLGQPIPKGTCREVAAGPEGSGALAIGLATVRPVEADGVADVSWWAAGSSPDSAQRVPVGPGASSTVNTIAPAGVRGVAFGAADGDAHVVVDMFGWFVGERSADRLVPCNAEPYGIAGIDMESFADEWLDYGVSTDGRPLRAFRHGSGPRVGLISTGLHGNELTGTSVLADLVTREPIPGWTLWLVPVANPDARAVNERFVHEVDMNRDFPVEWSPLPSLTGSGCVTTRTGPQPHTLVESRSLARAMVQGPFRTATVSISHHDNYNWVAPQAGSPAALRELADDYARTTGLRLPGDGGGTVPTSPRATRVDGGLETFADSLGMASFLVENKAGYQGGSFCAGEFGVLPQPESVEPHYQALRTLLTDGRIIESADA